MVKISKEAFFWLPRLENSIYRIDIDGTDETAHIRGASFTNAIIGEDSGFQITLDNNNDRFTKLYEGNENVDFYLDFASSATTKRFVGKIEKRDKVYGNTGDLLILTGTHRFHSPLLDVRVTESYSGASGDTIIKDLFTKYTTGYTSTNVVAVSEAPEMKWEGVSLFDAVIDICQACDCDAYVDVNQDIHFFKRNSVLTNDEAIVVGDNLIGIKGLKTDILEVRNKVKVVGEDNESLPVIYTAEDATSQALYGLKERLIKESNIANVIQGKEVADFNMTTDAPERGNALSFFLPSLSPGDYMWVKDMPQDINSRYRIVKFTHKLFEMTTECVIAKSVDLPQFLKDSNRRGLAATKFKDPYNMKHTFNLEFNNEEDISSKDSNVLIADGEVKLSSGSEGTLTTRTLSAPIKATEGQLQVVGESLADVVFKLSTDSGSTYKIIKIDDQLTLQRGDKIRFIIEINNANTVIKSLSFLYK